MFGLPGGSEWILLVLIVLLLFGSARLPRLARSMREAKDEFKKASNEKAGSEKAGSEKAGSESKVPEAKTETPEPAPSEDGSS